MCIAQAGKWSLETATVNPPPLLFKSLMLTWDSHKELCNMGPVPPKFSRGYTEMDVQNTHSHRMLQLKP